MLTMEEAKKQFDTFAGIKSPHLPANNLDALQVRLHRWQEFNFGFQPQPNLVLGILEELGELGTANDSEKRYDAIGDIGVYSTQLLTANRLALSVVVQKINKNLTELNSNKYKNNPYKYQSAVIELLSRATLKRAQKIRGFHDIEFYRQHIYNAVVQALTFAASQLTIIDVGAVILTIADEVMKRNWKENPINAAYSKNMSKNLTEVDEFWATESDEYLYECTHINDDDINNEFKRTSADIAFWSKKYADAVKESITAEINRKQVWSAKWIATKEMLVATGSRATIEDIKSNLETDNSVREARAREITAEFEKERIKGIMEAIRTKREMLISLGAHLRQEMQQDPTIKWSQNNG